MNSFQKTIQENLMAERNYPCDVDHDIAVFVDGLLEDRWNYFHLPKYFSELREGMDIPVGVVPALHKQRGRIKSFVLTYYGFSIYQIKELTRKQIRASEYIGRLRA